MMGQRHKGGHAARLSCIYQLDCALHSNMFETAMMGQQHKAWQPRAYAASAKLIVP
jgi:hypothetical protein